MTSPSVDLSRYDRIVFFTGAGLSAESGIPTYRGKGGLWNFYDYEEIACQRAFDRNPEKVWDFHEQRRADVLACEPNEAHRAIAEIQSAKAATAIITQNIDGLLQRAGCRDVIELHGSLWRLRAPDGTIVGNTDAPLKSRKAPGGGYWRPDIVWFEDPLRPELIARAIEAMEQCDCLVSVGASGLVHPAADLPRIASQRGALCAEINPEETAISHLFQVHLRGPATRIMRELWPARASSAKDGERDGPARA